jgi:tetratricopeptide (TPR) repeat protein
MNSSLTKTLTALAIFVFGFAAVFGLSRFIEENRPAPPAGVEDADLALQGAKLKNYSLGFNGLIADWYWMQSLQYIGEKISRAGLQRVDIENLRPLNPRLLYPLLDNASDLDPKFIDVYNYGAIVLPAIDTEQAIRLTEKGIRHNPEEWRLYQHLGFIYWKMENYEKAAEVYAQGAEIPGAAPFMRMMSAKLKNDGGSRETARAIYRQMRDESEDTQIKENANLRLLELDWLDERDAIRKVLADFKTRTGGRCPGAWREILPLLRGVKLPVAGKDFRVDNSFNLVDPTGAPYILDKENCDVKLNFEQTKLPF